MTTDSLTVAPKSSSKTPELSELQAKIFQAFNNQIDIIIDMQVKKEEPLREPLRFINDEMQALATLTAIGQMLSCWELPQTRSSSCGVKQ